MKTYILGDIHGEYNKMVEILRKVELIEVDDTHKNTFVGAINEVQWKKGCTDTLIQVGDMVDGCKGSIASFNLLRNLQEQAEIEGGKVIRLLGNHELAYISPLKCTGMDSTTDLALKDIIKQDVLDRKLLACHWWNDYIISHAGLTDKFFTKVESGNSEIKIVNYYNENLHEAVKYNDFNDPMFDVGKSRGGKWDDGGIFWADWRHDKLAPVKQIVGHTSMGGIIFRDKHINIDCGFSRCAHGVYEILKYDNGKFEVIRLED